MFVALLIKLWSSRKFLLDYVEFGLCIQIVVSRNVLLYFLFFLSSLLLGLRILVITHNHTDLCMQKREF